MRSPPDSFSVEMVFDQKSCLKGMKRESAIVILRAVLNSGQIVDAGSFMPRFRKEQIQPYLSRMHKQGLIEMVSPPVFGSKGAPARFRSKQ